METAMRSVCFRGNHLPLQLLCGLLISHRPQARAPESCEQISDVTVGGLTCDLCLSPVASSLQAVLHQSVFLSAMSPQPGRDLTLCWEQHRKLLPGVAGVHANAVQHWSVQQVRSTAPSPVAPVSPVSVPSRCRSSSGPSPAVRIRPNCSETR